MKMHFEQMNALAMSQRSNLSSMNMRSIIIRCFHAWSVTGLSLIYFSVVWLARWHRRRSFDQTAARRPYNQTLCLYTQHQTTATHYRVKENLISTQSHNHCMRLDNHLLRFLSVFASVKATLCVFSTLNNVSKYISVVEQLLTRQIWLPLLLEKPPKG